MHAVLPHLVDAIESGVLGGLPAHARPRNDGRVLAEFRRPLDAGIGNGFTRRDHRELRKAVDEIGAFIIEVGAMVVGRDFRSILEAEARAIGRLNRANSGPAFAQSAAKLLDSATQRRDSADTRDSDAKHALRSDGRGIRRAAGYQPFHALDHLAHVANLLGRLIRNGDVKFVLQSK